MPMRRLNVGATQLEVCIRESMFAIKQRQSFVPGELLLLQLTSHDARQGGKLDRRVEHVIEFDRIEPDPDGSISRAFWPDAGTAWPWIIYGRRTLPTRPFSLEALPLSRSYANQQNAVHITPEDEAVILPYIVGIADGFAGPFTAPTPALPPADPEVDQRGVEIAVEEVRRRFPESPIKVQPHNNPGFDILVGTMNAPIRYVEVKSTKGELPHFYLSETQRQFSIGHAALFSLVVVTGVNVTAATHGPIYWCDGPVDSERYELAVLQWSARQRLP